MDDILSGIRGFYFYGMIEFLKANKQQEEWKSRILKEYKNSRNLPRKKKKQIRKNLQIEWNIANYNPFNF